MEQDVSFTSVIREHKIMTMDARKRAHLFAAAMEEFEKGYQQANTDVMTQRAEISKGLLYHYFGTKKALLIHLLRYVVEIVDRQYQQVVIEGGDFIENIWRISSKATELALRAPLVYRFLGVAYFALRDEFPEVILNDFENPMVKLLAQISQNIDTTLFKEDVDIAKAINIVIWTVRGYSETLTGYGRRLADYQPHYEEIKRKLRAYLDMLKTMLYRST